MARKPPPIMAKERAVCCIGFYLDECVPGTVARRRLLQTVSVVPGAGTLLFVPPGVVDPRITWRVPLHVYAGCRVAVPKHDVAAARVIIVALREMAIRGPRHIHELEITVTDEDEFSGVRPNPIANADVVTRRDRK